MAAGTAPAGLCRSCLYLARGTTGAEARTGDPETEGQMMRRGFLSEYARHLGISKQGAAKLLQRAGVNYHRPFDFDEVDRLLDGARHPGRDHLRQRRVRYYL